MSQVPISQGRVVPDTDAERVAAVLERFTRRVAPDVLTALTEAIRRQRSGHIRLNVTLTNGKITASAVLADLAVDLDGADG